MLLVKRPARILALVLLGGACLLALRVVLWRPFEVEGEAPVDGYHRVAGVVHVHTTFSDGGGTPDEVISAARAARLSFVAITDHNTLDGKESEGLRHGVLVLVGTEISTTAGHVLGLGLARPTFRFDGDGRHGLDDIRHLGGFAFAAHPLSARADLRWTGWDIPGPWGIELINGDSEWRQAGLRTLLTAVLYSLNHSYALLMGLNSPDALLARWDSLLAERDVVGIAGADAHERLPITKAWALRLPSYESVFSLVQNHVLLDQPLQGTYEADAAAVLDALRRGRFYIGVDAMAPANEFSFTIGNETTRWTMGDSIPSRPGLIAQAGGRLPRGARILLYRDGRVLREAARTLAEPLPGPGVYRVVVRLPGWTAPWILTNPIAVFDEKTLSRRSRRADWPDAQASPVVSIRPLDNQALEPGSDDRSRVGTPILEAGAGVSGGEAVRLQFHLGEPTPDHRDVFCALVDWTHRDLSPWSGLAFWVRGDGEYRIWVQVRDENPASLDEGTEWWFTSVRTSADWTRVEIPFATLRSINPRTDGRLDLDKTRALVFVIDRGAVRPGTNGTIWLDQIGLY